MKFINILALLPLTIAINSFGQVNDTTAAPQIEELPAMEEIYDYDVDMPADATVEAPAIDDYYSNRIYITNKNNEFKTKSIAKLENSPDKPASYTGGVGALLTEIQSNLNRPYSYNSGPKFVILQITVGKDSNLYNPKIIHTEGSNYSNSAKDAIQKLSLSFSPATKNGKPVDSIILIPIRFEEATKE